METEIRERNKQLKTCAKMAFIFVILAMGLSQILSMVLPLVPGRLLQCIAMLLGTLVVMRSSLRPEKGTLMETHDKMTGRSFVVILGAFMLGKLISMLPALLLAGALMSGSDASALADISTVQDDLLLSFVFLALVTPFCEEVVFRGCIGRTCKKYGIRFGLIMSTVLFALYHGNVLQLFSTFLPGVVLFYVAMNYSILWSMLLHLINNGLIGIGVNCLQKVCPDAFITLYGEYILEALLILAALLLMKKNGSVQKVKDFLREPENEKGTYKATMSNVWFILLVLFVAVLSWAMMAMASGSLPVEIPGA